MRITTLLLFLISTVYSNAQDLNFSGFTAGSTSHNFGSVGSPATTVTFTMTNTETLGGQPSSTGGGTGMQLGMNLNNKGNCKDFTFTFSPGVSNLTFTLFGINTSALVSPATTYDFVDKAEILAKMGTSSLNPTTISSTAPLQQTITTNTITTLTNNGTISNTVSFSGQSVTELTIRFCNGDLANVKNNPDPQSIQIQNINWDGPLPVKWLSFDGKSINQNIQLLWKTASETNNELFEIERSIDAINFDKIGQISGNGNSTEETSYIYYDEVPLPGINYYRLKQTDFDGTYDYSKIIGVSNSAEQSAFSVFPNPLQSGQSLYIRTSIPIQSLKLFDLMGIETEISRKSNDEITTERLRPGKYILKTTLADGLVSDRQIVIK
jgi:hypothetical protein